MSILEEKKRTVVLFLLERGLKLPMKSVFQLLAFLVTLLISCDVVTSPSPEPAPDLTNSDTIKSGDIRVFPVNGNKQICNPSISMDTVNFKGCMLWLNFSGELMVNVPDSISGFNKDANQHDRLTISDTSNAVRWFMSRDEFNAPSSEELQDPEWTTHPHFINCLLSSEIRKKWSCYAIHTLSKKYLKMSNGNLNETSTPHLWISDTARFIGDTENISYDSDGFINKESVQSFFGTTDVKLVFSKKISNILTLFFVDFNTSSTPVQLKRPDNAAQFDLESALISPDGKWIVYNAYSSNTNYDCYIQELRENSKPLLFKKGCMDPHWWRHPDAPDELYIIYSEIPGGNIVSQDLSDPDLLSGEAGITYRQLVRLHPGYSGVASISKPTLPEAIVNLPLKGGWSPDGRYLCTGYDRAYLIGL